jgi:hypothetical protein
MYRRGVVLVALVAVLVALVLAVVGVLVVVVLVVVVPRLPNTIVVQRCPRLKSGGSSGGRRNSWTARGERTGGGEEA